MTPTNSGSEDWEFAASPVGNPQAHADGQSAIQPITNRRKTPDFVTAGFNLRMAHG